MTSSPTKNADNRDLVSAHRLDQLIEEATVDAHDVAEQAVGFFSMIEDNLALPFTTTLLGVEIEVTGIDMRSDDRIVAVCKRGRRIQHIDLAELPLPTPPPPGAEWIAAYRRWAGDGGREA